MIHNFTLFYYFVGKVTLSGGQKLSDHINIIRIVDCEQQKETKNNTELLRKVTYDSFYAEISCFFSNFVAKLSFIRCIYLCLRADWRYNLSIMEKLKEEDINLHIKMKLIGYYQSEDQFMRTEKIFPEKAEELANLLQKTFDTISHNKLIDEEMKGVFNKNTVFILKGEDGRLYGYYPKYNIARITAVHYVKGVVIPMPDNYKRWFYPGDFLKIYRPNSDNEQC